MEYVIRKLLRFFGEYRQFGLVILSILIALPLDLYGFHLAAHIVLAISMLGNVLPLLWGMLQDLRGGTYGVDILAATAIVGSALLHEYWAGIIIVLMLTGGTALEDYAQHRAKSELTALLEHVPTKAHLLRGRKEVEVRVSEVRAGDKLIIRPGEVVPVDAVMLEGSASFDEASLTGESLPVVKKVGEQLLSGSVNLDGAVTVRSLRSAEDSQFEQIIKLVRSAQASKAPFVRLADRYSIPFTLIAFGIGIAAWALSGQSIRFLEVLVVATPCPLILAAPIAIISGMSQSAKHGIIVKTGGALEQLATAQTVAFDKTGTLTQGKPVVDAVKVYGDFSLQQVIGLSAALEQNSNHILAKAVVGYASSQKVKIPKAKKVSELAGNGLSAHVAGKHIVVGRLGMLVDHDISLPKNFKPESVQQTAAFIAIDGQLAGVITFKDELRQESKNTLARLRKLGIRNFLMVTGDNTKTANSIAKQLGIGDVRAEALPADKLHAVESLKDRPVAFVGDGVNDAPVLAAADVGIALGARGSTAASESADIVIMLDNIAQVATGVSIAKRTFYIAKQSIWIGIIISIGLMFIFATGRFRPVYGAIVQEIVDVIVIFNALRAHTSGKSKFSAQTATG